MMRLFTKKKPIVYIVEDNDIFRLTLDMTINRFFKLDTYDFVSYEQCISAGEKSPDIILLDYMLPGINGLQAIPHFKRKWPKAHIIVISSQEDTRTALNLMKAGIFDYIDKNQYNTNELLGSVKKALDQINNNKPPLPGNELNFAVN